jgi:hypothetical protein
LKTSIDRNTSEEAGIQVKGWKQLIENAQKLSTKKEIEKPVVKVVKVEVKK